MNTAPDIHQTGISVSPRASLGAVENSECRAVPGIDPRFLGFPPIAYMQATLPLHKFLLPQTDCCSRRLFSAAVGSPNFSDAQNVTAVEQSARKQQHRSLATKFALLGVKIFATD